MKKNGNDRKKKSNAILSVDVKFRSAGSGTASPVTDCRFCYFNYPPLLYYDTESTTCISGLLSGFGKNYGSSISCDKTICDTIGAEFL